MGEPMLRDLDDLDSGIPGWVIWRTRAASRIVGLPSVRIDQAEVGHLRAGIMSLVHGQIAYHRRNARRMHHLDHRTHVAGTLCFVATMLVCVSLLIYKLMPGDHGPHGDGFDIVSAAALLSAGLPAFGAAIFGIRVQSDFSGLASRSDRAVLQLETLLNALRMDAPNFALLGDRLKRLAQIMVSDLASWRIVYQGRPLVLPA
jgi:hypothetical protein